MILLTYLAKMTLCSGILFGYYWLFLRNRRFHRYNRYYLLATLALSLTLPLIKIPVFNDDSNSLNQVIYKTAGFTTPDLQPGQQELTVPAPDRDSWLTFPRFVGLVYAAVLLLLLAFFVRSLLYIRQLSQRYPFESIKDLKLYQTQAPGTPFSFFHSIFWNDQLPLNSPEGQQVFRHELFHVQQQHSVDVLLAELVCMAGWFNPFFHLIKKELQTIHEFLADQYASSGSDRYAYAELLVQSAITGKSTNLTHPFFQNHIKRRIAMIIQRNNPRYSYWSRLMVLPISILLFLTISVYAGEQKPIAPADLFTTLFAGPDNVLNRKAIVSTTPADTIPPAKTPAASQNTKQVTEQRTANTSYATEGHLDVEKVRNLGNKVIDMKQVPGLLGEPQQKVLAAAGVGFWQYDDRGNHLRIEFDQATDKITSYSYISQQNKPTTAISYDNAKGIKANYTTSEAIQQQFGKPFSVIINPDKEVWEYTNPEVQLLLVFDATDSKNKVVKDFRYTENKIMAANKDQIQQQQPKVNQ
jgi:beta-lactamase regulating signal transducer with metallopeptidase domain